jgi:hypothetical protein
VLNHVLDHVPGLSSLESRFCDYATGVPARASTLLLIVSQNRDTFQA